MRKITTSLPHNIASAFKALVLVFCLLLATNKVQAQATAYAATCAAVGAANTLTIGNCTTYNMIVSDPTLDAGTPATNPAATTSTSCSGATITSEGWLKFVNPSVQTIIVSATSTSNQLQVQIISGACGALTNYFCADVNLVAGIQTEIATLTSLPIGTYFIRIVNVGAAASMPTSVCLTTAVGCDTPTALSNTVTCNSGTLALIQNTTMTPGYPPSCAIAAPFFKRERWYSYTMPASPALQNFNVTASSPTGNVVVQIFTGSCGSLTQATCANAIDNSAAQVETATYQNATAGQVLFVRVLVYGASAAVGNTPYPLTSVCINSTCAGANVGAQNIVPGNCTGPFTISDAISEATTSPAPSGCVGTTGATVTREAWFSFTSGAAGNYTVSATSTTGTSDLEIQVFTGTCGVLFSQVASGCGNLITGNSAQTEELAVACLASTTYYVRIINTSATNADMTLTRICVNPTPTNDACGTPQNITTPTPGGACSVNQLAGTVAGATPSAVADLALTTCSPVNATNEDVWYTFTTSALANQIYTITVNGMTDPAFQVFSTSPCAGVSAGTLITGGCVNVNGVGTATESGTFAIAAGVLSVSAQYWIRVFDAQTTIPATTAFTICITSPPLNDICSGAFLLTPANVCTPFVPVAPQSSTVMSATSSGVIVSAVGGCNLTTPTDDVWFYFVAPATGITQSITVNGTGLAPVVEVYDAGIAGTCGSFTAANSVVCNASSVTNTSTGVSFAIINNHTYYVRVYDYNGGGSPFTVTSGVFTICVINPPPLNDNCSGSILLTPQANCVSTAGTTAAATQSSPGNVSCGVVGATDDDVWYSFFATQSTHIVTVTGNGTFNPAFEVYSGSCGGLSLGCTNATGAGQTESTTFTTLASGFQYWVRVYDAGTTPPSNTTFNICITTPPINDPCGGAISLNSNVTVSPVFTLGTFAGATQSQAATGGGCGGTPNEDVWYSFQASQSIHFVTVVGSGLDSVVIELFSGNCGALVSLGCTTATGPGGTASGNYSGLTPGQTYLIRVYDFNSHAANSNVFQIAVTHQLNDQCTLAIPVVCGQSYFGSTVGASTLNDPTAACGSNGAITTPGVWYRFVGIGGNVSLNTSVSQFGTRINIYTGTCPGGPWTCVSAGQTAMGSGQSVTFNSVAGTIYWIFVYNSTGSSGTFTLAFTSCGGGVPNDQCSGALPIVCGQSISSSTSLATMTGDPTGTCGTSISAPGVWYTFVGTGNVVTADLCTNNVYDSKLHVFTGSCGGPYNCVTGNDDWCGLGAHVQWCSTLGVTYYIFVSGYASNVGNFTLTITCSGSCSPPSNDLCSGAIPVVCGGSYTGTTVYATYGGDYGNPGQVFCLTPTWPNSPGIWYVYHSTTSTTITATTCGGPFMDDMITVYSGSCSGGFTCITGRDDFCSLLSQVTFNTVPCTDYYILVNGWANSTGTFTLLIQGTGCSPGTPANDLCTTAQVIPSCGTTGILGTTVNATTTSDPVATCGVPISASGVWYVFTPADSLYLQASLCNSVACGLYNNQLNIYSGSSCASLTCIGGNNDSCGTSARINWFTGAPGLNYYVFVQGVGGTQGGFTLDLNGVATSIGATTFLPCQALPIDLISFTGQNEGKRNHLKWTTASETNNDYFTLEKSQDAVVFAALSRINGAGTSTHNIDYSSYDNSPFAGVTYYRLKQTDFNGAYTYSEIIAVSNTLNEISISNLRPNPTSDNVTFDIYSPVRGKATIQIMDYLGQMVSDDTQTVGEGTSTINVKMSELPKGVYSLKVSFTGSGVVSITKVVKN